MPNLRHMSGVLHPVGPEPSQTYWLRRVVVLTAAVLALVLFAVAVANATGSGTASPSPPPGVGAASDATTTASPSPTRSASPSSAADAEPSAAETSSTRPPAESSSKPKASASTTTPKTTTKRPPAPAKPAVPGCAARDLRVTVTGKRTLRPKQRAIFRLSVINGGTATCVAKVNSANFELKIFSGTDRIWSTNDCARLVRARQFALLSQQAVEWSVAWDGRRSRKTCKQRPEIPRPGTYFATAQLDGAKPVQLRMQLRG